MRRFSLVLVFFVALVSFPLAAEPLRHDRDERGARGVRVRIVRVIKAIFGVGTHGDVLTPPLPVAPPQP